MNTIPQRACCLGCRIRSSRIPVLLITLGVLALLAQMATPWRVTWPVLIIVPAALEVLSRAASWNCLKHPRSNISSHLAGLLAPLLWLAFGFLLLLRSHIPNFSWWALGKYWPALLIAWGLVRLAEQISGASRPGLTGADVAVVILLIAGGGAITLAHHIVTEHGDWGNASVVLQSLGIEQFHANYTRDLSSATCQLDAGGTLHIKGGWAALTFLQANGKNVTVTGQELIDADNTAEAAQSYQSGLPQFSSNDSDCTLRLGPEQGDAKVHYRLQVAIPAGVYTRIKMIHAEVQAQNLRDKGLHMAVGFGKARLKNVSGDIQIGGAEVRLIADGIDGSVDLGGVGLGGMSSAIQIRNVQGGVKVHGPFDTDVQLAHIAGPLDIGMSRTHLTATSLPGTMDITLPSLQATQVNQLHLNSTNSQISLTDPQGNLAVHGVNGPVQLQFSSAPTANVSVHSVNGNITVRLPPNSNFSYSEHTTNGGFQSDFNATANGGNGQVGSGGPHFDLQTVNGQLRFEKSGGRTPALQTETLRPNPSY